MKDNLPGSSSTVAGIRLCVLYMTGGLQPWTGQTCCPKEMVENQKLEIQAPGLNASKSRVDCSACQDTSPCAPYSENHMLLTADTPSLRAVVPGLSTLTGICTGLFRSKSLASVALLPFPLRLRKQGEGRGDRVERRGRKGGRKRG